MGRPPCCDKVEIKKGPWTPEEDIILVTYIQEHGPGNWRAVPTNTGLLRCSKSCRLRWTNYLRPGIKRGNFTQHEEGMIIHLQALLGNKWAAIASYLPQRTDNDIKNYWNTHLKKKLKKFQSGFDHKMSSESTAYDQSMSSKTYTENDTKSTIDNIKNHSGLMQSENSSVYASSAENISKLLGGWMRSSSTSTLKENRDFGKIPSEFNDFSASFQCYRPQKMENEGTNGIQIDELECILSFDGHNLDRMACDKSSSVLIDHEKVHFGHENKSKNDSNNNNNPPLSFLEKWFLDESAVQVEGAMELSQIF
ncbi:hypothetical protein ACJIZ3_005491 [Penstemon smallii]|uniref:Uncharacterized protein n=1 Tax=Penstemon smallii TaxID=265156 RepID=A0ABD3S540_9LAMI